MDFLSKVKGLFLLSSLCLGCICLTTRAVAQENTDSLQNRLSDLQGIERVPLLNELALRLRAPHQDQAVSYGKEALSILQDLPNDSLNMQSLHALGAAYMTSAKYDSALIAGTQSKELAETLKDTLHLIRSLNLMTEANFRQRNYEPAIEYINLSLDFSTQIGDSMSISGAALMLGNLHNNLGNYDLAIDYYERAAAIRRVRGEEEALARIISNTGVAYRRKGSYDKALEYYFEALGFFENQNNIPRIAASLTNLGVLSFFLGEYDDAIDYHSRALEMNESLNRREGIAGSLSNLGVAYNQAGRFEEALDHHRRSLALEQELGDKGGIANGISNIGIVYYSLGNYEQALDHHRQSLELKREIGNPESIINSLHNLVDVYVELDDETQAFLNAQEALDISIGIENTHMIKDSHEKLAALYESSGMYAEALESFKNYKIAEDSLFNTDTQSVISELQTRYRTKEQEQTILLLQKEQAIQRLWLGALLGGVILFGAIAFLGYTGYRTKKKALTELDKTYTQLKNTQAQLIQQEKLASLGQITAGIAHEIKNPLNFVTNFSRINEELIEEIESKPDMRIEEVKEVVDVLKANQRRILLHGERADKIVGSMMQHAHNSSGGKEVVDANELTKEYVKIAHFGMQSQNPAFDIDLHEGYDEEAGEISLVPQEIGQVIINLYRNAYDAVQEHASHMVDSYQPRIAISTKRTPDSVIIQVSDNGPGIPPDLEPRIFVPFFTTKETGKGTGLGLSLSYDIVTQGHGGQLKLVSEEGMGATFTIELPLD